MRGAPCASDAPATPPSCARAPGGHVLLAAARACAHAANGSSSPRRFAALRRFYPCPPCPISGSVLRGPSHAPCPYSICFQTSRRTLPAPSCLDPGRTPARRSRPKPPPAGPAPRPASADADRHRTIRYRQSRQRYTVDLTISGFRCAAPLRCATCMSYVTRNYVIYMRIRRVVDSAVVVHGPLQCAQTTRPRDLSPTIARPSSAHQSPRVAPPVAQTSRSTP